MMITHAQAPALAARAQAARAAGPQDGAPPTDSVASSEPGPVTRAALGLGKTMAKAGPARWGLITGATTAVAHLALGEHPAGAIIFGVINGGLQALYASRAAEYQADYEAGKATGAYQTPVSPAVSSVLFGANILFSPLVSSFTFLALQMGAVGVDLAASKILGDDALAHQPKPGQEAV